MGMLGAETRAFPLCDYLNALATVNINVMLEARPIIDCVASAGTYVWISGALSFRI